MKQIKVVHERHGCIGCNSCVNIAPQCWQMDEEDGKSRLVGSKKKGNGKESPFVGRIFEYDLKANRRAAAACPTKIIKIQ